MAKNKSEIILSKNDESDIVVECPRKIILGFFQTVMVVYADFPPMNIKAKQWKDFFIDILMLAMIILFGSTATVMGIVFAVLMYAVYFTRNKYYYWNFIQKKIDDGYTVSDDQTSHLTELGINFENNENSQRKGIEKVLVKIPGKAQIPAILATGLVLFIILLLPSSCNSDINSVRNGTYFLDDSITLGNAIDGYTYFTDTSWEFRKNNQGRKFVQVTCDVDMNAMFSFWKDGEEYNMLTGMLFEEYLLPDLFSETDALDNPKGDLIEGDVQEIIDIYYDQPEYALVDNYMTTDIYENTGKYFCQFLVGKDSFEFTFGELSLTLHIYGTEEPVTFKLHEKEVDGIPMYLGLIYTDMNIAELM